MTTPHNPTEVDRKNAAEIARLVERLAIGGNDAAAIEQGIWDTDTKDLGQIVHLVMRHRLSAIPPSEHPTAEAEGLAAELERLKKQFGLALEALEALADGEGAPTDIAQQTLDDITRVGMEAIALRNGECPE